MAKRFDERFDDLRERLLRAGVAPRFVRRYVRELEDHLADLEAEEQVAGHERAEAESAALARLGTVEELASAMTAQPQFKAWCVRAPWVVFGVGPVLLLVGTWCVALSILWAGWKIWPPALGVHAQRVALHSGRATAAGELASAVSQADQALYYLAPILVGWAVGLIAARQRMKARWPVAGLALLALLGGVAQVHASLAATGRTNIGVDMDLAPSVLGNLIRILQAMVILLVTLPPYLLWRGDRLDRDPASFDTMVRRPSALLPLAMSLGALALLLVPIAVAIGTSSGVLRDPDGGFIAHLWQILMTVQMPIVAFFAIKWLRRAPRQTLGVLALQAGAWLASCAPVYFLHL